MITFEISPGETVEIAEDGSVVHTTGVGQTNYASIEAWAAANSAGIDAWSYVLDRSGEPFLVHSWEVSGGYVTETHEQVQR